MLYFFFNCYFVYTCVLKFWCLKNKSVKKSYKYTRRIRRNIIEKHVCLSKNTVFFVGNLPFQISSIHPYFPRLWEIDRNVDPRLFGLTIYSTFMAAAAVCLTIRLSVSRRCRIRAHVTSPRVKSVVAFWLPPSRDITYADRPVVYTHHIRNNNRIPRSCDMIY